MKIKMNFKNYLTKINNYNNIYNKLKKSMKVYSFVINN